MRWGREVLNRSGIIILCLMMQGCAPLFGIGVSGRVVDVETGKPVTGAYVVAHSGHDEWCPFEAGGCHCVTLSAGLTRTDVNGYYHFDQRFYVGLAPTDKFGSVSIYKPGYITAPKMVANVWKEAKPGELTGTPEGYVARYAPPQYFYGTGNYRDNYQHRPLNSGADTYYLSSRPVSELRDFPKNVTPRVYYLRYIVKMYGGGCSYANKDRARLLFPLKRAIYEEAAALAKTPRDFELLNEICFLARGTYIHDGRCHIEDGPVIHQGDGNE